MSDCRFGVSPVNYPDPDLHISAYSCVLKVDMKIFVNVARLEIRQLLTQSTRRGHPCTLKFGRISSYVKAMFKQHVNSMI